MVTMSSIELEIMYEKNNLRDLYNWSLNGHSCWVDFLGIAHYDYPSEPVDFENYGYSARRFKPTNFNEVSFAGYGRDFKVNLELRNIEFY